MTTLCRSFISIIHTKDITILSNIVGTKPKNYNIQLFITYQKKKEKKKESQFLFQY